MSPTRPPSDLAASPPRAVMVGAVAVGGCAGLGMLALIWPPGALVAAVTGAGLALRRFAPGAAKALAAVIVGTLLFVVPTVAAQLTLAATATSMLTGHLLFAAALGACVLLAGPDRPAWTGVAVASPVAAITQTVALFTLPALSWPALLVGAGAGVAWQRRRFRPAKARGGLPPGGGLSWRRADPGTWLCRLSGGPGDTLACATVAAGPLRHAPAAGLLAGRRALTPLLVRLARAAAADGGDPVCVVLLPDGAGSTPLSVPVDGIDVPGWVGDRAAFGVWLRGRGAGGC